MAGRPPDTMRMYSHLYEDGGEYMKMNKGDKPAMRAFLRRAHMRPWFAAIADSGQKHVIPWTPINDNTQRRPVVMFEETLVTLPAGEPGWRLVDKMTDLLTAGATKEDITTGEYSQHAYGLCAEQIQRFEDDYAAKRGSPWFELAIWLAQRDEAKVQARLEQEKAEKEAKKTATKTKAPKATPAKEAKTDARQERKGKTKDTDNRSADRSAQSVPANPPVECAQTLDDHRGKGKGVGQDDSKPRGVGKHDVSKPAPGGVQLKLF